MSNIEHIIKMFPIDSVFYVIEKLKDKEFIVSNKVLAYRIEDDDFIQLVAHYENNAILLFNANECYTSKEEAEKHLAPKPETVRVAVDENGRLIDFAIFDGDAVIDVPTDYKIHVGHCCVAHGCKYGDKNCPVVNKKLFQRYVCEQCAEDGIFMEDLVPIFKKQSTEEGQDK